MIIKGKRIDSAETLTGVLQIISSTIEDSDSQNDSYEILETHLLMGRLIHLIHSEDCEQYLKLLQMVSEGFHKGGPKRVALGLPCIINAAIAEGSRILASKSAEKAMKIFGFVAAQIEALSALNVPKAVGSYLDSALSLVAGEEKSKELEEMVSRLLKNATGLVKGDFGLTIGIIGTLERIGGKVIPKEMVEECISQILTRVHEAPSVDPKEKCRILLTVAHVYQKVDPTKVKALLDEAKELAGKRPELQVTILEEFLYHYKHSLTKIVCFLWAEFERKPSKVDEKEVLGLCSSIRTALESDTNKYAKEVAHFCRTVNTFKRRALRDPSYQFISSLP